MGYGSYENHETFAMANWLSNDRTDFAYWTKVAPNVRTIAEKHNNVLGGIWTVGEATRYLLAEQMKEYYQARNPYGNASYSLWGELLSGALNVIEWHVVADVILEQ